ncbi:energy-coupling factor ABC transporter ATP-binding protein [Aquipuribacter nitratireducens]|uniref:Energy-coupling factor ABC transporter ATP-binding protein n=1 Tax=Aquipuribacter nitratireducens TaxID=650104 RepID=A0ABW0GJD4_9MICO
MHRPGVAGQGQVYARFDGVRLVVDGYVVLDRIDLALHERRVALVGANGSGKSTLLRCFNALVVPSSGGVVLDLPGTGALDPARSPAAARTAVGFVFTDPDAQVVMPTPAEDVALSLRRLRLPRHERDRRVRQALADVGLADRADVPVGELSSGQRQLLAVAAVLATGPRLLVLDEPTTLLDRRNTRLVRRTVEALDIPVVLATHDLGLAAGCDRVVVVDAGRVVADGAPDPVLDVYRRLMDGD